MAKASDPQLSWDAACSTGQVVNWFEDVDGPRARTRPRKPDKATTRQRTIRLANQVIWDRFPTLPPSAREAWAVYARQSPARRGRLYRISPAQFVYTACNIIPFDHRGAIYDAPPWSDPLVSPLSWSVFRDPVSLEVKVSASWPSTVPHLTLLDVWECHRWNPPSPKAVRHPWRHVAYLEAPRTSWTLPLDPAPHYLIGIRPVSPRGRTWRTWRTWESGH